MEKFIYLNKLIMKNKFFYNNINENYYYRINNNWYSNNDFR